MDLNSPEIQKLLLEDEDGKKLLLNYAKAQLKLGIDSCKIKSKAMKELPEEEKRNK